MSLYQASDLKISSGYNGTIDTNIPLVQNISIDYAKARQEISILGNSKALLDKNIINYTPVKYTIDVIKSNNIIEESFGLMNQSGVAAFLGKSSSMVGYGTRDISTFLINDNDQSYAGYAKIISGSLQSYNINVSVGDLPRITIGGEGLNIIGDSYTGVSSSIYTPTIAKSEDIKISGINFDGFNISGLSIQSLSLSLSFSRNNDVKLGYQFPEKNLISANANFSINGFLKNFVPNSGITNFNAGVPETGTYYITLVPSCYPSQSTTYKIVRPYIESFNFGASIGSFTSVNLGLSVPIGFTNIEMETTSNLIIQ